MPNIMDYLDWRGDLTFSASPFCEVDNLILSELAFMDFRGVIDENFSRSIALSDAAARLSHFREEDMVESGILLPKDLLPLLRKTAASARFRDVLLCGFESRTDTSCETQFAAVTMLLPDGTLFVSYRGTDDTLVGWKEDFNMSFLPVVPSQSYAVRYLERVADAYPYPIRVGGHSKGGNLAVYAAASVSETAQRRILDVYSNDGPGFSREFLDSPGYARIRLRVSTIVPQTSIVGMLLEHEGNFTIVKSTQDGILQHDGFSWEVQGASFVRIGDFTEESRAIDRTLKAWIAEMNEEERAAFVDALYEILSSANAPTISAITESKGSLKQIIKSITPEHRMILQKTLRSLYRAWQRVQEEDRELRREERLADKERMAEARMIEREAVDREKEERRIRSATTREAKRRRRAALMVAVRPIEFKMVRASRPLEADAAEENAEADPTEKITENPTENS